MLIVTGGAGFIGSNIVKALNARGEKDILIVDHLKNGRKFQNLVGLEFADYCDKTDFLERIQQPGYFKNLTGIFHQGACSTTTEWDGQYMMRNNYDYSKALYDACVREKCPLVYASSAAVYGGNQTFTEHPKFESPLNVYGYSKLRFDQWLRPRLTNSPIPVVGLRYFNVYGMNEQHKGGMASVAFHLNSQLKTGNTCKLFGAHEGYAAGEQKRDFVLVDDIAELNLWCFEQPDCRGIFNAGTGRAQTFNDVANAVIAWHGKGELEYIDFPDHLKGAYQSYTQADLTQLRDAGYDRPFHDVASGVARYLDQLNQATVL